MGFLRRHYLIIVLTLLFVPAVWDLLQPGFFPMHDDLQVFRLFQFHKCILDLQIPCRWVPDAGFGYGYPLMQFYPPMPYYPMELLKLLGLGYFWPVKIMFALAFIVSGWGMYLLGKTMYNKWGGFLSAILYVYAPYHSVDVYVRGAMNEAWGMAWFPFVILYLYKLITEKKSTTNFILLSVFLSLQLTSHNVMTMTFAPSAIALSIFWLWTSKNYSRIKELILAGLFGVGLAAFFFIPVVLEQKFVHVDSMIVGYFNFLAHFADIKQLFFSNFWGYGGSTWGPEDGMSFSVGQIQWVTALLSGAISIPLIKKDFQKFLTVLLFIFFGIGYAFLTHSRSVYFWDHISILQFSQFPWRLVALIVFYFSLAGGYLASSFSHRVWSKIVVIALILATIIWNTQFFKVERHIKITLPEKLSGRQWELQVTGGIFDYLPRTAPKPPGDPAPTFPKFVKNQGGILNYKTGSNWISFEAHVASGSAQITLPMYTYQGLKVKLNGTRIVPEIDPFLGLVLVDVPQGRSQVVAKIGYTKTRLVADLITLFSLVLLFKLIRHGRSRN